MTNLPVIIYTQPTCQACQRLKSYLKQKAVEYEERDVTENDQAFSELQQLGFTTTPVILVGDEVVVGFDQAKLERLHFP
ncbi:MAG: glutaredoxin family protein [Anaerolineae bacterium]